MVEAVRLQKRVYAGKEYNRLGAVGIEGKVVLMLCTLLVINVTISKRFAYTAYTLAALLVQRYAFLLLLLLLGLSRTPAHGACPCQLPSAATCRNRGLPTLRLPILAVAEPTLSEAQESAATTSRFESEAVKGGLWSVEKRKR